MTEEKQKTEPVSLSVKDLADAASYIDMAFRNGAYGAGDASEISTLYKKLVSFVEATVKQQQENKEGNDNT